MKKLNNRLLLVVANQSTGDFRKIEEFLSFFQVKRKMVKVFVKRWKLYISRF